jgi:hypothetical protein
MADLPYVINTGTLSKFFGIVQTTGVPGKVTIQYLGSIGFKSSNDRYLLPFLKAVGFVDSSGTPTETWKGYRHTGQAKNVMASAAKDGWPKLFELYPDAHRKDDEAIRNWMRSHSPAASPTTVDRSLKTFRAVCELADFKTSEEKPSGGSAVQEVQALTTLTGAAPPAARTSPEVVINIQLQIPATDNPDIYEKFFAAMQKHLYGGNQG